MISITKKIKIVVKRDGRRYFYSRLEDGVTAVDAEEITRERARQIVENNPDVEGDVDFDSLAAEWTWSVEL